VKLEQLSILTPADMVKVIAYVTMDRLHRETFMTVQYAVLVELLKEVVSHELWRSSVSTAFAYLSLLDFFCSYHTIISLLWVVTPAYGKYDVLLLPCPYRELRKSRVQ
jgi:hypothetical protein